MEETQAAGKLISNLEILAEQYKDLLQLLRSERQALIETQYDDLIAVTKEKELLLSRLRATDMARERYAQELKIILGLERANPSLTEIILALQGPSRGRLQILFNMLTLLVERAQQYNRENELYAKSGLEVIEGALANVKETLMPQKTYGPNKQYRSKQSNLGQLSEREA